MGDKGARQAAGSGAEAYARSRQYDYRAVSCCTQQTSLLQCSCRKANVDIIIVVSVVP